MSEKTKELNASFFVMLFTAVAVVALSVVIYPHAYMRHFMVEGAYERFGPFEQGCLVLICTAVAVAVLIAIYTVRVRRSLVRLTADTKKLRDVAQRFEYAADGTGDGLWDWDLITDKVYFSPQWKKMLGYADNELCNDFKSWEQRICADDLESVKAKVAASQADPKGDPYEVLHRLKHKNGHWVWVLSRGQTIFDENDKPVRMVGFHTDVTREKELERELQEKDEIMIIQSRHAAMGEMISMLAHQWRQPISVISMDANNILADVELGAVDIDELVETAEDIIGQTRRLSKTIDDFKSSFKPEKLPVRGAVADVISDVLSIVGLSLESNGIDVNVHIDESLVIKTYLGELVQVVVSLMKNAKEALVKNDVDEKRIDVSVCVKDGMVVLEIYDSGGGVERELMSKIFEPYFTTKQDKEGVGLGLYMSKTIVQKHLRGSIDVYNKGDGACFVLKLPVDLDNF